MKDGGMWAEWDDVFESLQCFVWPVYFSFLTMERANLIFTNINRTPETSHLILKFSGALGTLVALNENK